jgi:hypothetical protein
MSRYLGLGSVVALLCPLGCSHDGFLVSPNGATHSGIIVSGSVAHVSGALQDGLSDSGIVVLAKREGRTERLVGVTQSGKAFCIHLRPEATARTQHTEVSVEWGSDPDEQFWRTFTKIVRRMQEKPASPSGNAEAPHSVRD